MESSQDAIVSTSLGGTITSWNPAAERMFGYTSAEIMGKPIARLAPQERADQIRAVLARISAGQPVDPLETDSLRKDGTVFPVSLIVSPVRNAGGEVVGAGRRKLKQSLK